jgi:hypothetical protein
MMKKVIMSKGFEAMLPVTHEEEKEKEEVYAFYNEIQFILFGFEFSFMTSLRRVPVEKPD